MAEETLRESQKKVLEYRSGFMGISAVPGSGKTWTLSHLAAKLLLTVDLKPDQEILVVTFSNSAADNFTSRIGRIVREYGLLEGYGYRVRTLHSLAGDIIRERPELAGLGNDFRILDDSESDEILDDLCQDQLTSREAFFRQLLKDDLSAKQADKEMRPPDGGIPKLLKELAVSFIRSAKNEGLLPADLAQRLRTRPVTPLFQVLADLYTAYQDRLKLLGAVDFEDLIYFAWKCLRTDNELVAQLAHRWPFILEDEAQDSSKQQQDILRLITEKSGNWVRVGDPNQAIYQSFTTADPRLLKEFLSRPDVLSLDLPESGRSCQAIIDLANRLNHWVQTSHPNLDVRDSLSYPTIIPTGANDPQQNPATLPDSLSMISTTFSSEEELNFIVKEVKAWLNRHPEDTVAVLASLNSRVSDIANVFKVHKIDYVDVLMNVPRETQETIGSVVNLLKLIFYPLDQKVAARAIRVFYRHLRDDAALNSEVATALAWFNQLDRLEDFFYPNEEDTLTSFHDREEAAASLLADFRAAVLRWHQAVYLPFDQLMLVIAQDLPLEAFELATVHKASAYIKTQMDSHPEWSPLDFIGILTDIAKNERKFFSVTQTEDTFNPDLYKGKVILCTCHKAKGLEWDKVFLTSVNNYDFPSGADTDAFISEKWFIADRRNLQAEILAELASVISSDAPPAYPGIGKLEDRNKVIRDRLRLFYVGITRAKSSLTISYNTGRGSGKPALAYQALLEGSHHV